MIGTVERPTLAGALTGKPDIGRPRLFTLLLVAYGGLGLVAVMVATVDYGLGIRRRATIDVP